MAMEIREAARADIDEWLRMALLLWPDNEESKLRQELEKSLSSKREKTYLCMNDDGKHVGFIMASIRTDYVEGASTSPVGYIEGIFVDEEYRHMGIASKLVEAAEGWAREHGCTEMGSDRWAWNTASIEFHQKIGYEKGEMLVHFIKQLQGN